MTNKNLLNSNPLNGNQQPVFFGRTLNGTGLNSVTLNGATLSPTAPTDETIPTTYTFEHRLEYGMTLDRASLTQHEAPYELVFGPPTFGEDHRLKYGMTLTQESLAQHTLSYDAPYEGGNVRIQYRTSYGMTNDRESLVQHTNPWRDLLEGSIYSEHRARYPLITYTLGNLIWHQTSWGYELKGNTSILHRSKYTVLEQPYSYEHAGRYVIEYVGDLFAQYRTKYALNNPRTSLASHTSKHRYLPNGNSTFQHRSKYTILSQPYSYQFQSRYVMNYVGDMSAVHRSGYAKTGAPVLTDHRMTWRDELIGNTSVANRHKYSMTSYDVNYDGGRTLYELEYVGDFFTEHRDKYIIALPSVNFGGGAANNGYRARYSYDHFGNRSVTYRQRYTLFASEDSYDWRVRYFEYPAAVDSIAEFRTEYFVAPDKVSVAEHRMVSDDLVGGNFSAEFRVRNRVLVGGNTSADHNSYYKLDPGGNLLQLVRSKYSMTIDLGSVAEHTMSYQKYYVGDLFQSHTLNSDLKERGNKSIEHRARYPMLTDLGSVAEHRLYYKRAIGDLSVEHRSDYRILIVGDVDQEHRGYWLVNPAGDDQFVHRQAYDHFGGTMWFEHRSDYSLDYQFSFSSGYNIYGLTSYEWRAEYDVNGFNPVSAEHKATYSFSRTQFDHRSSYEVRESRSSDHRTLYAMFSALQKEYRSSYDVNALDPFSAIHTSVYTVQEPVSIDVTGQPEIWFNYDDEDKIKIISASIDQSEGEPYWTASIELADVSDFQRFVQDQKFSVVIFGEEYRMILDSKDLNRSAPAGISASITGVSPIAKADAPRSEPIEIEQTEAITFKELLEQIMEGTFINLIYDEQLINYTIPPYRVGAVSGYPISLLQDICRKVGLTIIADKSSETIFVNKLFQQSTKEYELAVSGVTHTVDDLYDILRISESYLPRKIIDSYRLTDTQGDFADKFEFSLNEGSTTEGVLKLYTSPYRTEVVVENVNSGEVNFSSVGEVSETIEEELVEFKNCVGATNNPVHAIVSVEWQGTSLGGVSFDTASNTIRSTDPNVGYGLAKITYVTKYLQYNVVGTEDAVDLFIASEPEPE